MACADHGKGVEVPLVCQKRIELCRNELVAKSVMCTCSLSNSERSKRSYQFATIGVGLQLVAFAFKT